MAAWLTYLRERFPIVVYTLLVGGLSVSGVLIADGGFSAAPFVASFVGWMVFFCLLRLMDERKDYEKDQVAHPERPLPRGLLSVAQVEAVIRYAAGSMVGLAILIALLLNSASGLCYLIVTGYLWLMYREFYVGDWLEPRPLLYALTHQVVVIPLCYFCVLVAEPGLVTAELPFFFSICIAGAFFAYEVCRKLDPQAHEILMTYLSVHGRVRTFLMVAAAMATSAVGAAVLGVGTLLLPFQAALLLSLTLLWIRPAAFKIPESIAGVVLLVHVWAVPARQVMEAL